MATSEKDCYKMLLIGQSGAGKTSFLNLVYNLDKVLSLHGKVDLKQFSSFHDAELERVPLNPMVSKTTGAKEYRHKFRDIELCITDTPGFGDTQGAKKDEEHLLMIKTAAQKAEAFDCCCLLINGRQPRATFHLKRAFEEISLIFGGVLEQSTIIVLTNVQKLVEASIDVNLLLKYTAVKSLADVYCIENPYCIIDKTNQLPESFKDYELLDSIERNLTASEKTIQKIVQRIKTLRPAKANVPERGLKMYKQLAMMDNQPPLQQAIATVMDNNGRSFSGNTNTSKGNYPGNTLASKVPINLVSQDSVNEGEASVQDEYSSYGMGILDEIHTNSSIKVEDNTPHCGRKKDPGGPAERDGKQSEGDELLENNGKSTERTDATSGQGAVHAVSSHEEEETDQMKSMQTESSQSVNTQPEPVQSVFPETKFNNARTSTSSATKSMQTLPMSNNPPAEKGQSHLKKENESTLTNNQGTAKTASYGEKEETASVTRNGNKSPSNHGVGKHKKQSPEKKPSTLSSIETKLKTSLQRLNDDSETDITMSFLSH